MASEETQLVRSILTSGSNGFGGGSGGQGQEGGSSDGGSSDGGDSQSTTSYQFPDPTSSGLVATATDPNSGDATSSIAASPSSTASSESTTTSTSDSSASDSSGSSGGMATKTKIAIAVPVAVVGAAIILAAVFFLIRHRKRKQQRVPQNISVPTTPSREMAFLPQEQEQHQPQQQQPPPPTWGAPQSQTHDIPFEGPFPASHTHQRSMDAVPEPNSRPRSQPLDSHPPDMQAGLAVTTYMDQEGDNSRTALTERNIASNEHEHAHGEQRPQSPFADPHDDTISQISGMSGGRNHRHGGEEMDDISSVSSFNDDDHGPGVHR